MSESEKETGIDVGLDADNAIETPINEESKETVIDEDIASEPETEPYVFERDDWQDKVIAFSERYPFVEDIISDVSECILNDDSLWNDENCLDKALFKVLCNNYTSDEAKASDEAFLEKYIYNNDNIKSKIVEAYMDELNESKLPTTMTKGGKISLAAPRRPRTIGEAGVMAAKIMRR